MALRRTRTVLFGLTGLAVAGGMAGLGTFATFTDSTNASQTLASGTVDINLGTAGSANNRLTIGASGMVPGDSVQRRVVLSNNGSESLASIKLTTVATASSLLDTDTTDGLQMKIERCTGAWAESLTTPYTYTCAGVKSDVLAERDIIGADLDLAGMNALASGASDDVVVTVTLPTSADNDFQGKSSTIRYTFDAIQRASVAK